MKTLTLTTLFLISIIFIGNKYPLKITKKEEGSKYCVPIIEKPDILSHKNKGIYQL